jgi:hypothetical protein
LPASTSNFTTPTGIAIEGGVNGFIVPPRDETAIAEKLYFLAVNESMH